MPDRITDADLHAWVEERLSDYVDNLLAPRERARLEAHLSECARCQKSLESLRWTISLLKQAPAPSIPRSFTLKVPPQAQIAPPVSFGRLRLATVLTTLVLFLLVGVDVLSPSRGEFSAPASAPGFAPRAQSESANPTSIALAPAAPPAAPVQAPAPTSAPAPTTAPAQAKSARTVPPSPTRPPAPAAQAYHLVTQTPAPAGGASDNSAATPRAALARPGPLPAAASPTIEAGAPNEVNPQATTAEGAAPTAAPAPNLPPAPAPPEAQPPAPYLPPAQAPTMALPPAPAPTEALPPAPTPTRVVEARVQPTPAPLPPEAQAPSAQPIVSPLRIAEITLFFVAVFLAALTLLLSRRR